MKNKVIALFHPELHFIQNHLSAFVEWTVLTRALRGKIIKIFFFSDLGSHDYIHNSSQIIVSSFSYSFLSKSSNRPECRYDLFSKRMSTSVCRPCIRRIAEGCPQPSRLYTNRRTSVEILVIIKNRIEDTFSQQLNFNDVAFYDHKNWRSSKRIFIHIGSDGKGMMNREIGIIWHKIHVRDVFLWQIVLNGEKSNWEES